MKNLKDITLSIFAIIGFISVITAFNTQPQQSQEPKVHIGTPESHIWEMHLHNQLRAYFTINKVTGEVRAYDIRGEGGNNWRIVESNTVKAGK